MMAGSGAGHRLIHHFQVFLRAQHLREAPLTKNPAEAGFFC